MNTTAIILAFNNLDTLRRSVRRLAKEVPVIVIDNDSKDGTGLWFADHPMDNVKYIKMDRNYGVSAKNFGISEVTKPYFFLIDGDSLYVPGTIEEYEKVLEKYPECGCVGYCDPERRIKLNVIGTDSWFDADTKMEKGKLYKGFKQVWAGYGLFRKCKARFPFDPPFNEAGWGIEDQWYLAEMNQEGLESYFMDKPLFYHQFHSSWKEIKDTNEDARLKVYEKKWGKFIPNMTYKEL